VVIFHLGNAPGVSENVRGGGKIFRVSPIFPGSGKKQPGTSPFFPGTGHNVPGRPQNPRGREKILSGGMKRLLKKRPVAKIKATGPDKSLHITVILDDIY
jgi:hypothetical protein